MSEKYSLKEIDSLTFRKIYRSDPFVNCIIFTERIKGEIMVIGIAILIKLIMVLDEAIRHAKFGEEFMVLLLYETELTCSMSLHFITLCTTKSIHQILPPIIRTFLSLSF